MSNRKFFLPFLFFSIVIIFFYKPLFNGFFQQDEWYSFTWYVLHKNLNFIESLKFFFAPSVGHYNPLTNIIQFKLLSLWGMNYFNFALLGTILHLTVTATLYFLAKIIFKGNNLLAFLCALLFGVFASPYQGTAWVIADISTLTATFLGLISAILFFKFLQHRKTNSLFWSLIILTISLFFKEITIGLFAFYFIYYFIVNSRKLESKHTLLIVSFAGVYLLFRSLMIFAPNTTGDQLVTQSQPVHNIIYNFLSIPIKSIPQIIFPVEFTKKIAFDISSLFPSKISGEPGSPEFESFAIKKVMEFMNLTLGLIVVVLSIVIVKRAKKANYKHIILLGLGWVVINSFIYSIAPETVGKIFVVDSRNLYFTSIGISLFIIALINLLSHKNSAKVILLFLPVIIFNIYWLNRNLIKYTEAGKIRKNILEQISSHYETVPDKTVFYITSDTSYYGLPENEKILPFQSGLGQTLLVWYYPKKNFSAKFFENKFLWDITAQGYKEIDNQGFGYFRDFDALQNAFKSYNISKDSVYAFSWNSKREILTETTDQVRGKLLNAKEKIF